MRTARAKACDITPRRARHGPTFALALQPFALRSVPTTVAHKTILLVSGPADPAAGHEAAHDGLNLQNELPSFSSVCSSIMHVLAYRFLTHLASPVSIERGLGTDLVQHTKSQ